MTDHKLNGKVVVITGASSGFGKGSARKFAEQGASAWPRGEASSSTKSPGNATRLAVEPWPDLASCEIAQPMPEG